MNWSPFVTVIGLLGACLVALLLVQLARREADEVRRRAEQDVAALRAEARAKAADVERREQRVVEREQALVQDRGELQALERRAHERAEAVVLAERAATHQVQDAERRAAALVEGAQAKARAELEAISGLSAEEALEQLVARLSEQARHEAEARVRRADAQARRSADARARRVIATAVQRLAVPTSAQAVITVVPLPSEEMKGRIIGKEGRNIRHFESLTGVNVLIDETPDAVVLSCFDVERREVAQVALEALMADGRIHPQRIEAAYADAVAGADERTEAAGDDAAERAGVVGLHPDLVRTLGRLRLRTSYGQNVLEHLVETSLVAGVVAAEVGADVAVTKRAALLHDLGKALTAEQPGTHALLGAELARRCGESPVVVNAIAAHHEEVPMETVEAVLVQAADAISAARPGARREDLDQYVERMGRLESLVAAHPGVRRALAMSAGHEVRVVVEPTAVTDAELPALATGIARQIEQDLSYPGEIKVTVVRELRASATAG